MQYIQISSTDMREIVGKLLELGKLGAFQTEECTGYKIGPIYQCQVVVEDGVDVPYDAVVRKGVSKAVESSPVSVVETVEKAEGEKYTKDELENMTLAEVRKATGISEGGKQKIIEQYLSEEVEGDERV